MSTSSNTIFIYLFTALASGGAVVISQYVGRRAREEAGAASSQLLLFSTVFSVVVGILVLWGNESMLRLLFGQVEKPVMEACVTYLQISAYSYPALAIYNAGAALFRSFGKTSVTMVLSVFSNLINVVGNLIGVFVLKAGVAGVAYPSLIARLFSAVVITVLCFQAKNPVTYSKKWIFRWDGQMMKNMLRIAIPNGAENGVFQLVKVALSSLVALFGTYQIAANGVAQSIWSLAALAGVAMGPVFITVIGQCMGTGDVPAAAWYMKKLSKITVLLSTVWNGMVFCLDSAVYGAVCIGTGNQTAGDSAGADPQCVQCAGVPIFRRAEQRAAGAGDVTFTMVVSIFSTLAVRLPLPTYWGLPGRWV